VGVGPELPVEADREAFDGVVAGPLSLSEVSLARPIVNGMTEDGADFLLAFLLLPLDASSAVETDFDLPFFSTCVTRSTFTTSNSSRPSAS